MPKSLEEMPYSQQNLDSLYSAANGLEIPVLFSLIPSPSDVEAKLSFRDKYAFLFEELEYTAPTNLRPEDYDGLSDANHFNNEGHQKYAEFLATLIEAKLAE